MPKTTADLKSQAAWLAALGEPTRLELVRVLATGEKTVTVLARACGTEMVNVSHHLGMMRAAGLVKAERDGRFMRYILVGAIATANALELSHPSGVKVVVPLG